MPVRCEWFSHGLALDYCWWCGRLFCVCAGCRATLADAATCPRCELGLPRKVAAFRA